MHPHVSVIIPLNKDDHILRESVQSCLNSDYPEGNYELILACNGTESLCGELASIFINPRIKTIYCPVANPYAARNNAAVKAAGSILVFLDSDCIVDKNWLRNLVAAITENDCMAAVGKVRAYQPQTALEIFGEEHIFNYRDRVFDYFLAGNGAVRKDVFDKLGGFDRDFSSGGDVELGFRMKKEGIRVFYEPGAVVYHKHRDKISGLFRQYCKYGAGWARLKRKWGCQIPMYPNSVRMIIVPGYLFVSIFGILKYVFGKHTIERKADCYRYLYLAVINLGLLTGFYLHGRGAC